MFLNEKSVRDYSRFNVYLSWKEGIESFSRETSYKLVAYNTGKKRGRKRKY
jgi:hypothetical protein